MLFTQGNKLINTRNWEELVQPKDVVCECNPDIDPSMYGRFTYEPLERGYGVTIGNALRRVLLSSLQGAAFVSVAISDVEHEFSTIPGVLEDITDVILNIKQVRLKMTTDEPQKLTLCVSQKGEVKASDIQTTANVTILNPDLHLATLTVDRELRMEFEARMGKGYVPADMHDLPETIGLIKLDASFSPVRRVSYTVEQARVGDMTNYDKLILEVWTDGSVPPGEAIAYSAKIIKDQISAFISFDEHISGQTGNEGCGNLDINDNLFKKIDELELSVRATNCLRAANIETVGELVQRPEAEMLKTKNFGKKSLDEIKAVLQKMGLNFGMKVDNFEKNYQEWNKRKQHHEA